MSPEFFDYTYHGCPRKNPDAILALQILAGVDPIQNIQKIADVNGDGKIGIEKTVYILEKIAGIRE